jgi:hypothetical protein
VTSAWDVWPRHYPDFQFTVLPSLAMNKIKNTIKKTFEMSPAAEPSLKTLLMAFRTIATILSHIQSSSRALKSERAFPTGDVNDREALTILDAMSTVLVREYEIIAVVAPPYEGSRLQVKFPLSI